MLADTKKLFAILLRQMDINCVCDVGAMDGSESLIFRRVLPSAKIFAFEANPENLRPMQANSELRTNNIEIVPMAVANYDGKAEFFVVDADYSAKNDQRGMSSLYHRGSSSKLHSTITVPTTRLDTFFAKIVSPDMKLAMWLDVEGKAFEVLQGASGLMQKQLQVVHVEVETYACIAPDQKLYEDVKALMESHGFEELACDGYPSSPQLNLIFMRKDLPFVTRVRCRLLTFLLAIRFHLRRLKHRLLHR